jgi:hypothetical protein
VDELQLHIEDCVAGLRESLGGGSLVGLNNPAPSYEGGAWLVEVSSKTIDGALSIWASGEATAIVVDLERDAEATVHYSFKDVNELAVVFRAFAQYFMGGSSGIRVG